MLDIALFKDEWGILLHFLATLGPLVITVLLDLDFLDGEHLFAF